MTIEQILKKRYPDNEYALLREVRDKAGFDASRSADYIAVSLWPSRGLSLNGIELKSGRGDWLSELKKPEKAENIFQYCDFFWLLTADENVAKPDEIPANWGWMNIKGQKITVKKDAPKLEPKPLTKHFVVAMLKRASDKTDYIHTDDIKDRIEAARESGRVNKEYLFERYQKDYDELHKSVKEFKEASGIDLDVSRWSLNDPKKIGAAVRFILDGGTEQFTKQLQALEKTANNIVGQISHELKNQTP